MGWSCSQKAGQVLDAWSHACALQTGSQNVFHVGETHYMIEASRREYDDGAITGKVLRFLVYRDDPGASNYAVPYGRFRIEGDGRVSAAPPALRKLVTL
jgi:hypothetical protein